MPDERKAFMHSWCGTIVITMAAPDWAADGPHPAGSPSGKPCPNSECTKPDRGWWTQRADTYDEQVQLLLDLFHPEEVVK